MYNNGDADEVPLHNLQSPKSRNHLPPKRRSLTDEMSKHTDENGNGPGPKPRPGLNRKKSHNVMNIELTPEKSRLKSSISLEYKDFPKETMKRIDYMVIYENKAPDEEADEKKKEKLIRSIELRKKFTTALKQEHVQVQEDVIGENVFMKLHVPLKRLCQEAERVKLEMPLEGCEIYEDKHTCCSCWRECINKNLRTDDEVDFVSAAYVMKHHFVFEHHDDADKFFRPALRCFLTHHILINIDIRKVDQDDDIEDPMAKKGLPYLLHKKVYKDAFIMHDETKDDPIEKDEKDEMRAIHGHDADIEDPDEIDTEELLMPDTRRELMQTWGVFCPQRYQPFWKIRNYFGEKIALYFAWVGILIATLWLPSMFGFAVFIYGLYLSASTTYEANLTANSTDTGLIGQVTSLIDDALGVIKLSFDNTVTPYYALAICLWGTVFLEVWKRKNATLAYEWDVDDFEDNEVDRPQFVGTKIKPDPIILGENTWYYPMSRQFMKFLASFSFLITMIIVVFISAGSVILYRVFMTLEYCSSLSSVSCLLITIVASSLLNAVVIIILGKVYDLIAIKLTDWENHRTQTNYDDALIIKLFAFQFANSYTSCFYIAFFRGYQTESGLFGMGSEYQDKCGEDGNCMAMLSFQVLVLMLVKPFPKLLRDIILPWLRKLWRKRKCCRKKNKIETEGGKVHINEYMERERLKPDPGDVTLGEYTEKVLLYGFLMLFAASFPLAPLIALLICLIDIRVDARRLMWMYRRPVNRIAQDIGMWFSILQFLNFVGVVTNAFLIAFTSSWGNNIYEKYGLTGRLWVVIGFEHLVFFIKMILAALIPDVPTNVKLGQQREKYQVSRIMQDAHNQKLEETLNRALTQSGGRSGRGRKGRIPEINETAVMHEDDETGLLSRRHNKGKSRKGSTGNSEDEAHGNRSDLNGATPYEDQDYEGKINKKIRKKKKSLLEARRLSASSVDHEDTYPLSERYMHDSPHTHEPLEIDSVSELGKWTKSNTTTVYTVPPISPKFSKDLPPLKTKSSLPPLSNTIPELSYGEGGDIYLQKGHVKFPGEEMRYTTPRVVSDNDSDPYTQKGSSRNHQNPLYDDSEA